ncbi:hypothetical protein V5O48_010495 [Marasmius crinis-equi]|uniref:Uncharacterized protein n=1 Tax=Marasmius crinis-equi TaxID=585013 RepID=A0ABR3F861_9AGAR
MHVQHELSWSDDFLATPSPSSSLRQTLDSFPTADNFLPSLKTTSSSDFVIDENYISNLAVPPVPCDPSLSSEPSGASAVPYQQDPLLPLFTSQYPPFEHHSLPPCPDEWLNWQGLPDPSNASSHLPPHSSGSFNPSMSYQRQGYAPTFPDGSYSQPPSKQQLYFPQLPHHPMQFRPQQPETLPQLSPGQSPQVAQSIQTP